MASKNTEGRKIMLIAVTIVQLMAALVLILIVLFQSGKSQGLPLAALPTPICPRARPAP